MAAHTKRETEQPLQQRETPLPAAGRLTAPAAPGDSPQRRLIHSQLSLEEHRTDLSRSEPRRTRLTARAGGRLHLRRGQPRSCRCSYRRCTADLPEEPPADPFRSNRTGGSPAEPRALIPTHALVPVTAAAPLCLRSRTRRQLRCARRRSRLRAERAPKPGGDDSAFRTRCPLSSSGNGAAAARGGAAAPGGGSGCSGRAHSANSSSTFSTF